MTNLPDIYFLHIPKTAGTTLAQLIRCAYPQEMAVPAHQIHQLVQLPRAQINSYRCYTGHFGTGLFSLLDRPIPTVTVLRDPFERSASEIFYVERTNYNGYSIRLTLKGMKKLWQLDLPILSKTIEKRILQFWLEDRQTRTLGVDMDLTPYLGKKLRRWGYSEASRRAEHGVSMDRMLECAKRRLDECVVVGTVERFNETVQSICAYLGIDVPANIPRLNVNSARSAEERYRDAGTVPSRLARLLDQITEYDRDLYAYANHLMDVRREQSIARKSARTAPV